MIEQAAWAKIRTVVHISNVPNIIQFKILSIKVDSLEKCLWKKLLKLNVFKRLGLIVKLCIVMMPKSNFLKRPVDWKLLSKQISHSWLPSLLFSNFPFLSLIAIYWKVLACLRKYTRITLITCCSFEGIFVSSGSPRNVWILLLHE